MAGPKPCVSVASFGRRHEAWRSCCFASTTFSSGPTDLSPETEEFMLKRVLFMVAAAGLVLASGYANQPNQTTEKIVIPANRVDPTNGKQMYSSYCAPCHGQ